MKWPNPNLGIVVAAHASNYQRQVKPARMKGGGGMRVDWWREGGGGSSRRCCGRGPTYCDVMLCTAAWGAGSESCLSIAP